MNSKAGVQNFKKYCKNDNPGLVLFQMEESFRPSKYSTFMKMYFAIIITFILCSALQCKDDACKNGQNGLTVINNSNKNINFEFYWNYPDTTIEDYNPSGNEPILPGDSFIRGAGPNYCWEEVFKDIRKEWIYIFDQDTISTLSWNVVQQTNRGLLERRLIDLNYLQQHDFKIIYP